MLSQTNSIDLNTRHGNILGCAEVIHALYLYARQSGRYRILQCIMNLWYLERKLHQPWLVFMRYSASILVDLKFGDVDFCGGRKTGEPGEKPLEQSENQQQTQPTYGSGPESNQGQIGGRQTLSLLCHPFSPEDHYKLNRILWACLNVFNFKSKVPKRKLTCAAACQGSRPEIRKTNYVWNHSIKITIWHCY